MPETEDILNNPEGLKSAFNKGVDRAIVSRELNIPQAEAAANQVKIGIVGPLELLGDLGLNPDEIAIIHKYAGRAAEEMQKSKEAESQTNPLLALDGELYKARELARIQNQYAVDNIERARQSLRKAQDAIKRAVQKELDDASKQGQEISNDQAIERICNPDNQHKGTDHYFYTKLAEGRLGSQSEGIPGIIKIVDSGEGIDQAHEASKGTETGGLKRNSLTDLSTKFEGVFGQFPLVSRSYQDIYIHYGITLDKDTVVRVAKSPNLPN